MNRCSTRFCYLLGSLFALIAVANHFNFTATSAADILNTTSMDINHATIAPATSPAIDLPATFLTTRSYEPKTSPTSISSTSSRYAFTIPAATTLPIDAAIIDVIAASDPGTYHYRSLYYGHAAYSFGAIKSLSPGDLISAAGATYRVIATHLYSFDHLATDDSLRSQIYNYQGITLMTCGGPGNTSPAYRTVVFAEKV